jgi:hypothetical protein
MRYSTEFQEGKGNARVTVSRAEIRSDFFKQPDLKPDQPIRPAFLAIEIERGRILATQKAASPRGKST